MMSKTLEKYYREKKCGCAQEDNSFDFLNDDSIPWWEKLGILVAMAAISLFCLLLFFVLLSIGISIF
jgi:hypothetical protein